MICSKPATSTPKSILEDESWIFFGEKTLPWRCQVAAELIPPGHQHIVVRLTERGVVHREGGSVQGPMASLLAQVGVRLDQQVMVPRGKF